MPARSRDETLIEQLIAGLTADELREVVSAAVDRHGDVERQVRLIAARAAGDLAQLRAEVDRGLRRFLGYRESAGWAMAARPIVAELEGAVVAAPSRALVELLQRAVGHVVKVIMHADDSDGAIAGLADELLALHARTSSSSIRSATQARWASRDSPRIARPSPRGRAVIRSRSATRASGWRSSTVTSTCSSSCSVGT